MPKKLSQNKQISHEAHAPNTYQKGGSWQSFITETLSMYVLNTDGVSNWK